MLSAQDANQPESVEPFEVAQEPVGTASGLPNTEVDIESELQTEPAPEPELGVGPAAGESTAADTAEPEPEPEPDAALVMAETLARIEAKLEESHRLLDRQSEVSGRLHAENQTLRAGELRKAQLPLVLNILRVYDDIKRMAETAVDGPSGDDLRLATEAMVDALQRSGVEPLTATIGEAFDAKRHKVSAIDPASEPEVERTVSRVVRAGFAWSDGELVRVSDVAVFKYAPPAKQTAEQESAATGYAPEPVPEPSDTPSVS